MRLQKRAYRRGLPAGVAQASFVVGCQRSGTDMVLWTLDKSLDVDRFDENHPAAFTDCRIKDRPTRDRLVSNSTAKCVLFKPVCDSHNTAKLLADHKGAKAVWVYRNFRDVANSAVVRWGEMNLRYVRDLVRGRGDWGRRQWNRELITPEHQAEIEQLCEDELNAHGAAAIFWLLVNRTFFDQRLGDDPRVILTRYEDLVTSPIEEFRRLCGFLGVAFREEMTASIFSSSVRGRSKAPIGSPIVSSCATVLAELDRVHAEQRA